MSGPMRSKVPTTAAAPENNKNNNNSITAPTASSRPLPTSAPADGSKGSPYTTVSPRLETASSGALAMPLAPTAGRPLPSPPLPSPPLSSPHEAVSGAGIGVLSHYSTNDVKLGTTSSGSSHHNIYSGNGVEALPGVEERGGGEGRGYTSASFDINNNNNIYTYTTTTGVDDHLDTTADDTPLLVVEEEAPILNKPVGKGGLFSRTPRSTLLGPKGPRCSLRLWGFQCRGLRSVDRNGLSDPYLTLRIGTETYTSRIFYKTLNPCWDEAGDTYTFGLPVSATGIGGGNAAYKRCEDFEKEDVLYIRVRDHNTFKDVDMGEASVFFGDLFPTEPPVPDPVTGILPTQSKGKALWSTLYCQGQPAGEIFLCLEANGFRPLPDGAQLTLGVPGGLAPLAPGASQTFDTAALLSSVSQPPNCLKVSVHGAKNLIARGLSKDSCNAYVRLDILEFTARTNVAGSTVSPSWNEGWAFPVVERAAAIECEVNHSRTLGPAVFEGRATVYLSSLDGRRGQPVRGWYPLVGKDGVVDKDRGELDLELCWEYNPTFTQYLALGSQGGPTKISLEPLRLDAAGQVVFPDTLLAKLNSGAATPSQPVASSTPQAGAWGEVVLKSETDAGAAQDAASASASSKLAALSELEVKDGDWQVQVHIIEARQLKAENYNGTSDPVVYVAVGGKTQYTPVHRNVTACVFDHHLFFNFPKISRAELEAFSVDVSVFDSNIVAPKELIGKFVFDALDVYYQPHHCYHRRWVGLVDPTNGKDRGLQGYLRISVSVLGPGDRLYIPDENVADAPAGEPVAAGTTEEKPTTVVSLFKGKKKVGMDIARMADGELADVNDEVVAANLVLLPPSIKRETRWLVIGCHAADGLPAMDEESSIGLYSAGIDAYLETSFAGNPPIRTQWITALGKGNLGVEWNRELWIPFNYPTFTNRIELAVYDFDRLKENDRVGTIVLNYKDVDARPLPLAWWPLYGAPSTVYFGKFKNRMNRLPSFATHCRGRVLLSARVETHADNKGRDEAHWKPCAKIPRELLPPLAVYRLRALVIAGDELPLVGSDLGVTICVGGKQGYMFELLQVDTPRVKITAGQARWNSLLECDVTLPLGAGGAALGSASPAPLPDTFVYIYKGDPSKGATRISYARLDTSELISRGLSGSTPYWQPLQEDLSINAIGDDSSAGSVLLRVGIGALGEAISMDWRSDLRELEVRKPYELRVHVFQGRSLAAADDNGLLDPFLRISMAGDSRFTSKRFTTTSPSWYETISLDVMLPSLRFAPQVHIELWDYDEYSSNDFVGELRYNLASPDTLISSARNLPTQLPPPKWYTLSRLETKFTNKVTTQSFGEVLLLVQLVAKDAAAQVVPMVPASIVPACKDMVLDIIALGCRNLAPVNFLAVSFPHAEFAVGGPGTALNRKSQNQAVLRTGKSRFPSGTNPNFCERIQIPVKVPEDPLFASNVTVTVKDNRLGSFTTATVGTTSFSLDSKIPWSGAYCVARGGVRTGNCNPFLAQDEVEESPAKVLLGDGDTDTGPKRSKARQGAAADRAVPSPPSETASDAPRPAIKSDVSNTGLVSSLVKRPSAAGVGIPQLDDNQGARPTDLPEAKFMRDYNINLSKELVTKDAAEHVDDMEQQKYLKDRREYGDGLETVFGSSPFETFPLHRGQVVGRGVLGANMREIGKLKGIVRLCNAVDEPSAIDMSALLNPKTYVVRVYVLTGHRMQPKDSNGKSDCYLIVKLGDTVIKRRADYIPSSTEPEFYQSFEFRTLLPGPSLLTVEVWDYDAVTSDDFIGSTTVDLEDRWFEPAWQELGAAFETPTRLRPKPIERRNVWSPRFSTPQGQLRLWVDILQPEHAVRYPLINITPPPPKEYEVRMIVWKAKGMKSGDALTDMNDLYIKAFIEGMKPQSTDVHLRAKKGVGSWNWRMKWNVQLPRKFFYLTLQAWDQDIVKYNDCLGEAKLDLRPTVRRCLRAPTRGFHVFSTDKKLLAEKEENLKKQRKKDESRMAVVAAEEQKKRTQDQEQLQQSLVRAGITTPEYAALVSKQQGDGEIVAQGPGGSLVRGNKMKSETGQEKETTDQGHWWQTVLPGANGKQDAGAGSSVMGIGGGFTGGLASSMTGIPLGAFAGLKNAAEAGDAKATVSALKKAAGIETDVHPEHGQWVELKKTTHTPDGITEEKVGEVLVSIELLPAAIAQKYPAGFGRSQPNQHPTLPPPIGRIRCSANPCYLMSEFCGPRLCTLFMCAFCCIIVALAVFFGAPFINTIVTWLQLLPRAIGIPIAVILGLLVCIPPIYCYLRFICCPPRIQRDEAVLDGSASDETSKMMDGVGDYGDVVIDVKPGQDDEDPAPTTLYARQPMEKEPLLHRASSASISKRPSVTQAAPQRTLSTSNIAKHSPAAKRLPSKLQ